MCDSVENDNSNYFTRELDVSLSKDKTCVLKLHQKIVGDVSCIVWDAAIALAKFLEKLYLGDAGCFKGKNIVELGSGVGCAGLVAAILGGKVKLTDLSEAISVLEFNVLNNSDLFDFNKGSGCVQELKWGEATSEEKPDYVLLSDCVYYEDAVVPLIKTLLSLATSKCIIYQAQEMRESDTQMKYWNYYIDEVGKYFMIREISITEQNEEYSSYDIKLFQLTRK